MSGMFENFERQYGGSDDEEPPYEVVEDGESDDAGATFDADAEIDRRLAKAPYYRAIINEGIIQDDGSDLVAEVNADFAEWARGELRTMLGVAPPKSKDKVELPFTDEEIQRLKELAAAPPASFTPNESRVLKTFAGQMLAKVGERPVDPVVRRVNVNPAPATVKKQPVEAKPVLNRQQPRPTAKPQAAAPAPKPAPAKPKARPPAKPAKPVAKPAKPVAKAEPPTKPKGPKPATKQLPRQDTPIERTEDVPYEQIPLGQVFRDLDGALYKIVGNPHYDPDKEGSRPWSKIKVQNQVGAIGRVPMPSGIGMTAAMQAASEASFDLKGTANQTGVFPDENGGKDVFSLGGIAGLRGN